MPRQSARTPARETRPTHGCTTCHTRGTRRAPRWNIARALSTSTGTSVPHSEECHGDDRRCQHRLRHGLRLPGAAHDAGPGVLLRRHEPEQERPEHDDDELQRHRRRQRPVGALRLRPDLRRGQGRAGRLLERPARAHRPDRRRDLRLGRPGRRHQHLRPARPRLRRLPAHVRDHHGRAHQRRRRRPDAVRGLARLHRDLGDAGLLPRRALGLRLRRRRGGRRGVPASRTASSRPAPAAGSSTGSAPSTSPAARPSTSTPAPRRSR